MSLGVAPHPQTGKTEPDKAMARFNIDLLAILMEKTKNNLSDDEQNLINHLLQDLRMKFVQLEQKLNVNK